jgi:predicted XRE-type DNA-binding protein
LTVRCEMTKKKTDSDSWSFSLSDFLNMDASAQLDTLSQITDALELISVSEAAKIRGVTTTAIHNLIKRGRLRSKEISGEVFVFKSEVENFERAKPGRQPKGDTEEN